MGQVLSAEHVYELEESRELRVLGWILTIERANWLVVSHELHYVGKVLNAEHVSWLEANHNDQALFRGLPLDRWTYFLVNDKAPLVELRFKG